MTKETIQLKEAIKILLRDGKSGRLFEAAKTRFLALYNQERADIIGADFPRQFADDINTINAMIK